MDTKMISIVIPVYNEKENIPPLFTQIKTVMDRFRYPYEVIFVDDGSSDESYAMLRDLAKEHESVKLIRFRRNFGQTPALSAGFNFASGKIIVTMDADLQNDPEDIPRLVNKIDEGYDLVCGWRKKRKDPLFIRKIPSLIANSLIVFITGIIIHDTGCTLKAMRKEIVADIKLYGEMHRFIPFLAHWQGAKIAEMVVSHHPRKFGQTKYGLSRTWRVILDLITVKFLLKYFESPIQIFGKTGLLCFVAAVISGIATLFMKAFLHTDMTGNPLLYLTILCIVVGVQFVFLGLLGEVSIRIYYESQNKSIYAIRETVNLEGPGKSG